MRRFLREQGLTLFFGAIFLLALLGQAVAGHADYNAVLLTEGLHPISFARYVTSAAFATDVTENWQSEYLQFFLYIVATVWLLQKGSPESKELDKAGEGSHEDQKLGKHAQADSPAWAKTGGWRQAVYARSLGLVMGTIFLLCWLVQSISGEAAYNDEQLRQLQAPVSYFGYLRQPDFWSRTFQNWQSEFLAVGSMAALSIYLRQRGSPESKPVGAAHDATGVEG
jgi:Domain of unknown function (DUF6766)